MNDIWKQLQGEITNSKEEISGQIESFYVLNHSFETSISAYLADLLCNKLVSSEKLNTVFKQVFRENNSISNILREDVEAVYNKDFSCQSYLEALFFRQGFHALAVYRFANHLHQTGQVKFSKWLQYRMYQVLSIDIHPSAKIGKGIVLDHAVGTVIGETTVIEDNVFLFHQVTLGGTGKCAGQRHPKVCANAFIGANSSIIGQVIIGENSIVGVNSVVLNDVLPNNMVAGFPAKVKKKW